MRPTAEYARRWAAALWADPRGALRALPGAACDYRAWRARLTGAGTPLSEEIPWIPFAVKRFLDGVVTASARVFEYGSGGSTLYFARRARSVVAVEHDPAWYEAVRAALLAAGLAGSVELSLIPAEPGGGGDPSDPAAFASNSPAVADRSFRAYAEAIDVYSDGAFDLVVVDGRARPSCIARALRKVRPGGWLLLDDSERPYYARAARLLDSWERRDWYGPAPFLAIFFRTSMWRRP